MIQVINGQLYECAPEVKDYITKLENENKYHISKIKSMHKEYKGLLRTPAWEYDILLQLQDKDKEIAELKAENAALRLLIEWAEECDFGYDNFPEEYERYKDEIEGMGYIEGMIHIAKRVYQQKNRMDGGADDECKKV